MAIPSLSTSDLERFWAKVDKTETCWHWTAVTARGYGQFHMSSVAKKLKVSAHRLSYALAHGEIPDGFEVDHLCHNKGCVNPAHLRACTRKQNSENLSGARTGTASGIRGVHWAKREQKWSAHVKHDYKNHFAGYHATREEAEAAVIAKRLELFTHNYIDRQVAA